MQAIGMLQVADQEFGQPQDVVQSLLSAFDELEREEKVSEETLKAAFEKEYAAGALRQTALLEEQASLAATKRHEIEVQDRLSTAEKYLEKKYSGLVERKQALRVYLERLSKK